MTTSTTPTTPTPTSTLDQWLFLLCLIFTKMMLATARRNLSPFVPYLAQTLNTDVQTIAVAIASQRFVQIFTLPLTPVLWNLFRCRGSLVLGKARVMIFAVLFLAACLLIIALSTQLYLILLVIGLSGAAKAWFDPSGLSLMRNVLRGASSRLRGAAAAGLEFNWGLASLVGVPVSGVLLAVSFALPFLVLAVTTVVMVVPLSYVLYKTVKREEEVQETGEGDGDEDTERAREKTKPRGGAKVDNDGTTRKEAIRPRSPPTRCCTKLMLVMCSVPTVSNMIDACCSALFMSNKDMSFGLWLNATHHYDQLNIARVSTIFGGADLLGEALLVVLLAKGVGALSITRIQTVLLMVGGLV